MRLVVRLISVIFIHASDKAGGGMAATILMIDDEVGLTEMLARAFARAGYQTLVANDGTNGIRLALEHRPDVILIDDNLPDVSGSEVCAYLKEQQPTVHTPIILTSGGSKVYNPWHLQKIGAHCGLPKPSPLPAILQTVAQALSVSV
jgi:DNA-binding response OmpR family regulator